jgi:hypothetical protein
MNKVLSDFHKGKPLIFTPAGKVEVLNAFLNHEIIDEAGNVKARAEKRKKRKK